MKFQALCLKRVGLLLGLAGIFFTGLTNSRAEQPTSPGKSRWIDPQGISGSLVICGGGTLPESVYKSFFQLAGGKEAKLVIVPTASDNAEALKEEDLTRRWKDLGVETISILHAADRKQANDPKFLTPLKEASAVWFRGGQQSRLAEAYQGTEFETELKKLLERGGVVGGTSAGAAIQTRVMIASGKTEPVIKTGLDLLPGAIIDQHFSQRNRETRLRSAVKQHPDCVGFGIDEGTAMIVGTMAARSSRADRGRTIRVMGSGNVTVMLAASESKPMREVRVPENRVMDLTQLRRAARERLENFPPRTPAVPKVEKGSLVIIGGGGMPRDVVKKILELAGGPDAKIVSLPTANSPEQALRSGTPSFFLQAGAKAENITILLGRGPKELSTPEMEKALKEADCVWFGGGRQWRFMDAYDDTPCVKLFHDVLKRGGVICGSSAGASIQGDYLARADALTNRPIMAEGYERGLNFLPGVAIDQHFAQRKRFNDLEGLIKTYPAFLGIGIDEATAIIVQGDTARVMGRSQVHFYDAKKQAKDGTIPHESLPAGGTYNLVKRLNLSPAIAEKPPRTK